MNKNHCACCSFLCDACVCCAPRACSMSMHKTQTKNSRNNLTGGTRSTEQSTAHKAACTVWRTPITQTRPLFFVVVVVLVLWCVVVEVAGGVATTQLARARSTHVHYMCASLDVVARVFCVHDMQMTFMLWFVSEVPWRFARRVPIV